MASIFNSLAAIERCEDFDSLKTSVRGTAQAHGYDRMMMFSISTARDELLERIYWVEGQWFNDGEALDAETYIRHCPVTRHILGADQPFFWTKTYTAKGKRYRFVDVPRGPGFHGLQVPVFGHAGLLGAVSFGGEKIDSTPEVRLSLTQLGATAFLAARGLLEPLSSKSETGLSEREREVLQWVATGRRVADIAAALGLSERTVENHLRRTRHRLRAKTTAQAIGAALRSGSISV